MPKEHEIGDSAYLKKPERGYRYVEVVGEEPDGRLTVQTESGYEFKVWGDELEETT
jgi:hypothetical protein